MSKEKITEESSGTSLPPEIMPQCWKEDQRMNALFSPFRSKSANPQDWISKYKFWKDIIHDWLKYSMQCSFTMTDLNVVFKRKGCSPLCLTTVIEEMTRNGIILSENDFLKEPLESWTLWSIDILVARPLTWSVSKVKNYVLGSQVSHDVKYVNLEIVEELADIILSVLETKPEGTLQPISEIVQYCQQKTNNERIKEETVRLVLIWLRNKKKAAFRRNSIGKSNELLVKLSSHKISEVSDTEESLYKLLRQEIQLLHDIEHLEKEKIGALNEAKACVAKELKQVAKTHLRKKAELDKTIEKRANALENLRALISSIRDTHANSAVLAAYKAGSNALRKIEESGLTEDNVRDVMDDVSMALEDQKEVQATLSESLCNLDKTDDELEDELAELLKADAEELPDVPVSQTMSELEDLENRLKNLPIGDSLLPGKSYIKSHIVDHPQKKKVATPAETG